MDQFVKDSQNPETAKLVDADEQIAHGLIVLRTPTFFILNRKAKKVDVAIGGKQLIEKLQGIPGVPSPPPSPTTNTK